MLLPLPPENHLHTHINHFQNAPASKTHGQRQVEGTYKIKLHYLLERSKFYLAPGCHYAPLVYADNSQLHSDNDFDTFQKWWQFNTSVKDTSSRHTGTPYRQWCSCKDWMGPEPEKPHLISPQQGRVDSVSKGTLTMEAACVAFGAVLAW